MREANDSKRRDGKGRRQRLDVSKLYYLCRHAEQGKFVGSWLSVGKPSPRFTFFKKLQRLSNTSSK